MTAKKANEILKTLQKNGRVELHWIVPSFRRKTPFATAGRFRPERYAATPQQKDGDEGDGRDVE